MLNAKTAVDATNTAINSQGSAMREQLVYSESLEARINRLQNAWYGLAATAGDSIIYDSIVVLTSGLQGLTEAGDSVIGKLGALAPIFGIAATAAVFFSGTLRGLVVQKYAAVTAAVAQAGATGFLGTAMGVATVAAGALATAVRVLLTVALPVGVAFAALGFAIEKFTSALSANIQEQEKIDTYIKQNTDALTTNKETVDELVAEYTRLDNARANSDTWNADKEKEYLRVSQQLGDFFPALVDSIDATGQAHLKSADGVREEISALEKLMETEKKLTVSNSTREFQKLQDKLEGGMFASFENFVNGSLKTQIEGTKNVIKLLQKQGDDELVVENEARLAQLEYQYAQTAKEIQAHIFEVAKAANTMVVSDSVAKSVNAFITSLDTSNLDANQLKVFSKELSSVQEQFQKAANSEDAKVYEDAQKSLNKLAKEYKLLNGDLNSYTVTAEEFFKAIGNGNIAMVDGEESANNLSGAVDELAIKTYELKTAQEQLAGTSQQQVDDTNELLFIYESLTISLGNLTEEEYKALLLKPNLTAEEKALIATYQQREGVLNSLLSIYPELLDADGKSVLSSQEKVKAIEQENKANEILLRAYKLSSDGKLSAEQRATVAQAQGTKARIDNIKLEIQALNVLQKQLQEYYNAQIKGMENEDPNDPNYGRKAYRASQVLGQVQSKTIDYSSELVGLQSQLNSSISGVDSFVSALEDSSSSKSKNTKATKDNNKASEQSIYIADKYKQKLEELNLAIQKQIALREKLPEDSAKFTISIETQLKLEQEKLNVLKQQEKSLQSQIKSGKIQETGVVKKNPDTTKTLSGYGGRITSKFGERADNHRGTDIAGAKGTGVDAFTGGKVVAAGRAGGKGAEKLHSSYGNVVVVQSDDGTKRIYAHLEKVLTKVGQQIETGARIGTIGSTGNSTGNHLHYEKSVNGKLVDSYDEVIQARKGVSVSSGGNGGVINGQQQSIDGAMSDLNSITSEILNQEKAIDDLRKNLVDATLSGFERRKSDADNLLENSDNRLAKATKSSAEYRKELDLQATILARKQKVNKEEIAALKQFISSGNLTEKTLAEYTDRLHELGKVNSEIDLSLKGIEESKLESYLEMVTELTSKYDTLRSTIESTISYEDTAIKGLNATSEKYTKTLERINSLYKEKQTLNNQELKSLTTLINTGGLYGEALENAKSRLQELRTEIVQLQLEIQEGNFEILINIKNQADEQIDDFQFEIDRAEALRKLQSEGSADYRKYTDDLIKQQELVAQAHLQTRDALLAELKVADITAERKKEVLELIEAEHLAYLNATIAVKDYTKQLEESNKKQLEQIANDVVSALKAAYQARRDDHIKLIEEELKREEEAHNKRVKQLNDEMNLFRKNVEERLQLIDRQEAERGYNEEIDELEKERNKVQQEFDLLSLDDSNEAKSKRKKLQEQLDKIDKDIADKRHDRDIELQKQGLNDALDLKENEIDGKLELEDKEYQAIVDRINREKQYWEKYYEDLLNDERKFAKLREEILAGNFANVEAEFAEHIQYLKDSLPGLEDTLNGTMEAVGTSIRQNLIDQLQLAITKIGEFQQASSDIGLGSGFSDGGFNPNTGKDDILNGGGNTGSSGGSTGGSPSGGFGINGTATDADIKVLAGKYLNEIAIQQSKDPKVRNSIKAKADALAAEGRAGGSKIVRDASFNSIVGSLDSKSKTKLRGALNAQANHIGDDTVKNFIKNNLSSLDTGGMLSTRGGGFDGKGGFPFLGHDGEVVNNPLETEQLLKTVTQSNSLFDKLRSVISPVMNSLPNFNITGNQAGLGESIVVNLNGTFNNTSQSQGKLFGNEIANAILTKKGGNW